MLPKTAALLWDMIDHAQYIVTKCERRSLLEYESDRDFRFAIERAFQNIGEAARRLASQEPALAKQVTALSSIIAFRNVLAHDYDEIDNTRVWAVIRTHLPVLIEDAKRLLPDVPEEQACETSP
jgi:uncharacterized protein with HEPN domain